MGTRTIENDYERRMFIKHLESQKLPCTASVAAGKVRTTKQNRLQRLLVNEIAEQRGDCTPEEVRGECKLCIGVPILRDEHAEFRAKYDEHVKPLPYAQKLAFMMDPISFPVTSIMTTKQKARYLDDIYRVFSEQGMILTDPDNFMNGRNTHQSEKAA